MRPYNEVELDAAYTGASVSSYMLWSSFSHIVRKHD